MTWFVAEFTRTQIAGSSTVSELLRVQLRQVAEFAKTQVGRFRRVLNSCEFSDTSRCIADPARGCAARGAARRLCAKDPRHLKPITPPRRRSHCATPDVAFRQHARSDVDSSDGGNSAQLRDSTAWVIPGKIAGALVAATGPGRAIRTVRRISRGERPAGVRGQGRGSLGAGFSASGDSLSR